MIRLLKAPKRNQGEILAYQFYYLDLSKNTNYTR